MSEGAARRAEVRPDDTPSPSESGSTGRQFRAEPPEWWLTFWRFRRLVDAQPATVLGALAQSQKITGRQS